MNVDGRVTNLTELFYNKAADLQSYIAQHDPAFARRFTTELFDFISDVVAPNPYAFIEYQQRPTPEMPTAGPFSNELMLSFTR